MATVIAFANDKGGVAKTTSVANVGAGLALRGRRVLLIDADPQGNLSELFGADDVGQPGVRLEDVLSTGLVRTAAPWSTRLDPETGRQVQLAAGVDLLPCTEDLAAVVDELSVTEAGAFGLRDVVALYDAEYDYVIIDTPPGAGALKFSTLALLAADWVIVPARPADFDVGGAVKICDRIDSELSQFNPTLRMLGVLITQVDRRWTLGWDTRRQLKADGIRRLNVEIPFMVRVARAPRYAAPTVVLEPDSRVGRAYIHLARDLDHALGPEPTDPDPVTR